jgi:cytochrome P450
VADPAPFDPATFDLHAPAFLAEPWDTYARFREHVPVTFMQTYNANWVFRYEDVQRVLTDRETFVKNPPGGPKPSVGTLSMMAAFPQGLFMADPPRHTRLRAVLEPAMRTAMADAPAIAASYAEPLVAKARTSGRMELVADYALAVPSSVVFRILGVPDEPGVWSGLIAWQDAIARAHDITQSLGVRAAGATCGMALRTFLTGLIRRSLRDPASATGMLAIVCPQIDGELTVEDVAASFQDLVVAGYLSTTWLIASGVRRLLAHPEQVAALRDDPALIAGAVDEVLRYDDPVQVVDRMAAVDTTLAGVALKPGDKLGLVVGSANHDPEAFAAPEDFDITRSEAGRIGFGAGDHHCIGGPLVRLMAPVALQSLLTLPGLAVDGLAQWQTDPYLRGMVNLPLRVG